MACWGRHRRASRWWPGTLAAWAIAFSILDVPFTFDAQAVLVTVAGGGAATLLFGLLGAVGSAFGAPGAAAEVRLTCLSIVLFLGIFRRP